MENNKVLARVNNNEITQQDYDAFMSSIPLQIKAQVLKGQPENKIIKEILNELIYKELLYIDAKEKGYHEEEAFQRMLKQSESSLLTTYAIGKLLEEVAPTDREVEAYYNANAERYDDEERVEASHILVADEETADEVIRKLDEGEQFEDLAMEYSECPSKNNGGNLGIFGHGDMVKPFEDAVFAMNEDEISAPVKTDFGYHIIKLNKKIAAKKYTLSEVRDKVYEDLKKYKEQMAYTNKIEELYKKHTVEINDVEE
ncbi:MAG: peptidylprolyl isomerase [Peptoniphilus sp.]|nr:peptidylprolyl isomerase [Peptoniphilus sp.]